MDRQEEETTSASSGWGLGKLAGFMKRLVSETPITDAELSPVIESLKKVSALYPVENSWLRRTLPLRLRMPFAIT